MQGATVKAFDRARFDHIGLVTDEPKPDERWVEETRVWQKQKNGWKHVHFHRSPLK